jgi:tetraacyldisaccharide 4'-kinase
LSGRRGWAWPLVPVYTAALRVKEALRGEAKRLAWPVVSVGSVSAGGAGKTPVVIALARLLKDAGWAVDVLSRGYGREGREVERVVVEVADAARRFGDEPVVIAQRAGVDVWVGAERYAAGLAAEAQGRSTGVPQRLKPRKEDGVDGTAEGVPLRGRSGAEEYEPEIGSGDGEGVALREEGGGAKAVHLLDDGFQHRQLGRAVDVVLVTVEDLEDVLLPAGNLRERLAALQRADVVVVREDEVERVSGQVWPLLREGAQMWTVRRRLQFPAPMRTLGAGLRPVAFCAIARPEGFAAMLAEAGCGVVETVAFGDHHRYAMADVERVVDVAKGLQASGFVTTEKDAVKLTGAMRERLASVGPLMVVGLEAEFGDAEAVVGFLEARMREQGGGAA